MHIFINLTQIVAHFCLREYTVLVLNPHSLAPGLNLELVPLPGYKNIIVFPRGASRVSGYPGLSPESLGPCFDGKI